MVSEFKRKTFGYTSVCVFFRILAIAQTTLQDETNRSVNLGFHVIADDRYSMETNFYDAGIVIAMETNFCLRSRDRDRYGNKLASAIQGS